MEKLTNARAKKKALKNNVTVANVNEVVTKKISASKLGPDNYVNKNKIAEIVEICSAKTQTTTTKYIVVKVVPGHHDHFQGNFGFKVYNFTIPVDHLKFQKITTSYDPDGDSSKALDGMMNLKALSDKYLDKGLIASAESYYIYNVVLFTDWSSEPWREDVEETAWSVTDNDGNPSINHPEHVYLKRRVQNS